MELKDLRVRVDEIDAQLTKLFQERMDVVAEIGKWKRDNNYPIFDNKRERAKLDEIGNQVRPEFRNYTQILYSNLFELSRCYQRSLDSNKSPLRAKIDEAIENTPRLFPKRAMVACQGVEGANSSRAAQRLFSDPSIMYFKSFESVFTAIEEGFCEFGVLPIENSSAGSVKKVYDLMLSHDFKIVRSLRLKIDHNLLAKPGVKKEDIKEVFSHEQAISQCQSYLEKMGVKVTRYENTAMAAQMVSQSERNDIAAIASMDCRELYDLQCIDTDIQDRSNNYTRFICISKNIRIYPGADKTSIMMTLPHKPGALSKVLQRFYSLGINLIKLESRPLPQRDFEFMFFFDLETSVYSEEFAGMIDDLQSMSEGFVYLGSYNEVV